MKVVASGSTQQRGIRANDRLGDEQRRAQLKSSVPQPTTLTRGGSCRIR